MDDLINGRTPEEIKAAVINCDEHCSCIDCPEDERDYCDQSVVIKYARRLIEHLESQQSKWISVEEQPTPPEEGSYWCYGYWIHTGRKQMEDAEYLGDEWKIANNFVLTHWMPLPEPPKEDAHADT